MLGAVGGHGTGGRCALAVDADGRAELERLSRSAVRGEADRARAVPWPLGGETSAATAARLGVRAGQVRRWRCARGGPRDLAGLAADRPVWTLARLAAEIRVRTGETVSPGHLSVVLRKGAIAGAGRAIAAKAGRTPARSTVPACGSGS